jgi:PAS domain S-box-containing protein
METGKRKPHLNETTFQDLLHITPIPIAIHAKGIVVYANTYAATLMGASTPQQLIGKPILQFIHPDFVEIVKERVAEILSNGKPYTDIIHEKLIRLSGEVIDVEITSLRTEFNGKTAILLTLRNITEMTLVEQQLWKSNHALQAVIQSSPQAIYVVDTAGKVQIWNTAAERIFGWTESEVIGKMLPIAQKDKQPEFNKLMRQLSSGKSFTKDLIRQRKDGSLIDVNISATPLVDEEGKITSVVAIASDITERKEIERRKDEFLGIASHELKTPVTSIKAFTQVLERMFTKKGDDQAAKLLSKMDTQIDKLTNLIADLLDVTKIQAGKMKFNLNYFDINSLLEEIVEELQRTTEKHTIQKVFAPTVSLYGDRERTGQVITNFLTNAIKYSPVSHMIIVSSELNETHVTVKVKDFGLGIKKESMERVFEQYYRVTGPHQETYPGLGLGLYISHEIIKRQGGKIWVESEVGKGSTFCFMLPLKNPTVKE